MRFVTLDLELNSIAHNIAQIKQDIRANEALFARKPNSVFLLAVSKGQSIEKIEQAIQAGQIAFGENHLQEALLKIVALSEKKLEWHFIGLIQRNKSKKIAEHFTWVHSVTDAEIAKRLNDQRPHHLPPLNICLQVNTSGQINKAGAPITEVVKLVEYCHSLPHLKFRGLMTIPLPQNTFDEQRNEFSQLNHLFQELNSAGFNLDTLSMGMSNDMKAAIAEGATIVRIGTTIFGNRA